MSCNRPLLIAAIITAVIAASFPAQAMDISHKMVLFNPSVRKIYVANAGADSATCGKLATPCKTMNYARQFIRANKRDKMFLNRGDTFREQYELVDKQYLGPYGSGAMPVVSGADPLPNASFSKTGGYTNVYEISLPSIAATNNTYASITGTAAVLMTWENNARLGGRFQDYATSIATVDATPGRWWWDSANKKLYVHTTDSTSPITNGRTYEASVRTLALHGGDAFFVEKIQAEKAYALTTIGQQGYQLLGYKGGTYYKCKALYGWNHNAGIANGEATTNELLFDSCLLSDMENITAVVPAGSLFVAYKNGLAALAPVKARNCVYRQPTRHGTAQNKGVITHGNSVSLVVENPSVENLYYGIEQTSESPSTFVISGKVTTKNCYKGVYAGLPQNFESVRSIVSVAGDTGIDIRSNGVTVDDGWFQIIPDNTASGVYTYGATDVPVVTDSYFARQTSPSNLYTTGVAGRATGDHYISAQRCTFVKVGNPLNTRISGSDYNTFYGFIRVANDVNVAPGYFSTLAAWQAASGQDIHSTAPGTAPTLPAGFWDIAIPDVIGE